MTVLANGQLSAIPLPAQPDDVPWPNDYWPIGSVPSGIASELEHKLEIAFATEAPGDGDGRNLGETLAVAIVHQGRLVAERYAESAEPSEQLISWSMAKSVTHALVGMLVGEGRIDIEAPAAIASWLDATDGRQEVTVDQLLRMVPGTAFVEDYVDGDTSHCIQMLFGPGAADMAAYTAALPSIASPGTVFNYSSGNTLLLCRLLADIVGQGDDFAAWAQASLFDPIGMSPRLTFDGAGTWVGSSYLHATARDFARFGLLYARDGVWNGRRLLPEGWVDHGRTATAIDDEDGAPYGAQWWIWGQDHDVFYAAGYETQRIIIDPAADLVLVRLGKTPADDGPTVDAWLEEIRLLFHR